MGVEIGSLALFSNMRVLANKPKADEACIYRIAGSQMPDNSENEQRKGCVAHNFEPSKYIRKLSLRSASI